MAARILRTKIGHKEVRQLLRGYVHADALTDDALLATPAGCRGSGAAAPPPAGAAAGVESEQSASDEACDSDGAASCEALRSWRCALLTMPQKRF